MLPWQLYCAQTIGKILAEEHARRLSDLRLTVRFLTFFPATELSKCSRSPATLRFCRLVSDKNHQKSPRILKVRQTPGPLRRLQETQEFRVSQSSRHYIRRLYGQDGPPSCCLHSIQDAPAICLAELSRRTTLSSKTTAPLMLLNPDKPTSSAFSQEIPSSECQTSR